MQTYRRQKKSTVQLTSLLDLLFVMIFVSLLQQKQVTVAKKSKPVTKPKTKKVVTKPVQSIFNINATFYFYGSNATPNIPSGKYLMQGKYDKKDGKLRLFGVGWLERPQHYDMVPLSGKINSSQTEFQGRVEAIGCQSFTLKRKVKGSAPISGQWVGEYRCAQGTTGLTLTIE